MAILHILTPGHNSWSKSQLFVGKRDISLTEKGRKQAHKVSQVLKILPITAIYTSRNTNARQYATLIQEELCPPSLIQARQARQKQGKTKDNRVAYLSVQKRNAFASIKVIRDRRLDDLHMGVWQGKYQEEVENRYSEDWNSWLTDPINMQFDGGDSIATRCSDWFGFLSDMPKGQLIQEEIVVITHKFQFQLLLCTIENVPLSKIHQFEISDASYLVVQYNKQNEYTILQPTHAIDPYF